MKLSQNPSEGIKLIEHFRDEVGYTEFYSNPPTVKQLMEHSKWLFETTTKPIVDSLDEGDGEKNKLMDLLCDLTPSYDFEAEGNIEKLNLKLQEHYGNLCDYKFVEGKLTELVYEPFETIFETSGKIIIENDLREFFCREKEFKKGFNVCNVRGRISTTDFYAKQGLLFGYVGNSCPQVLLSTKSNKIKIGGQPKGNFKSIAWICTDLWWYSIVDYEVFKNRLETLPQEEIIENEIPQSALDISKYNVVEIPAGTWKLTHTYGITSREKPFATLKLIKNG